MRETSTPSSGHDWTPWRAVVAFGLVSLAADMVYEVMRSAAGPFLGSLGASALTVGIVTGAGEAIALGLRVVAGPVADRTGRHWGLTTFGYALTAACVPLLAFAPLLGAAGVAFASVLMLAERTGKAIRSPSKSTLLAGMAEPVGRGRGFAVHKALDQVGAFAGPLVVAGVAAATGEPVHEVCSPHRSYRVAMAPPMAAAATGAPVPTIDDLLAELRWPPEAVEVGWLETVGGPRSPVAADGDAVTLAERLDPDLVVLVADAGLGTINAALVSAAPLDAWPTVVFLNRFDPDDALHRANLDWLRTRAGLEVIVDLEALSILVRGEPLSDG